MFCFLFPKALPLGCFIGRCPMLVYVALSWRFYAVFFNIANLLKIGNVFIPCYSFLLFFPRCCHWDIYFPGTLPRANICCPFRALCFCSTLSFRFLILTTFQKLSKFFPIVTSHCHSEVRGISVLFMRFCFAREKFFSPLRFVQNDNGENFFDF